jgi:ABC-2 type transport system ATP-binding protein
LGEGRNSFQGSLRLVINSEGRSPESMGLMVHETGAVGNGYEEMEAIAVDNLCHTYNGKDYVVNDVSFKVGKGEIFGLLGRNGAGKTTTIRVLTTLMLPTRGNVRVLGYDVRTDGPQIRKRIGVVQQDTSFEFTTVKENLDLYGFLWGVPKDLRQKRRDQLIKTFGLEDFVKARAFDLSGGLQRRLQVAREFMHDMDLLFLDEPTVGLDPLMRRKILDMLKEKANVEGLTILFTTHNLEEADYLCDRVAIIDKGKIEAIDTIDNLKRLYGETKSIEISLASSNALKPSYENFFERLLQLQPGIEISRQPTADGRPAVLISRNVEETIQSIIAITSEQKARVDWLNIRKSTLEDVFIKTVTSDMEERNAEMQTEGKRR